MPKCSECRYGEWYYEEKLYICHLFQDILDESSAENNDLPCDGYDPDDRFDGTTEE